MDDSAAKVFRRQAFTVLSDLFGASSLDAVLEIEILPDAIAPPAGQLLLKDGYCIGVPKKVLRLAFIEACILLHEHATRAVQQSDQHIVYVIKLNTFRIVKDLETISRVALLYDPEHLTACNHLKRLLAAFGERSSPACISAAVEKELRFVESVVTSPLHRQSKSPTLWFHRLHIVQTYVLAEHEIDAGRSTLSLKALIIDEARIILCAAERHPNNYYAWQYLRRLFEHINPHTTTQEGGDRPDLRPIFHEVTQRIADWCLEHPSDISGWTFLLTLLHYPSCSPADSQQIMRKVIKFTESMSWRKEAVWSFLRSALAEFPSPEPQDHQQMEAQVRTYWSARPLLVARPRSLDDQD